MKGSLRAAAVVVLSLVGWGCASAPAVSPGSPGVLGRVVMKDTGAPVSGAFVYVYRDWTKNFVGVADFTSQATDGQGAFRLDLPPGKYGVVARKRLSGDAYGTLATGDLYDNRPGEALVEVGAGGATRVDFSLITMKEPMFFRRNPGEATDTGVRGRLLDEKGQPVAGGFAIAYQGPDMKRLPEFASTLTENGGRFTLYLPSGGRFWLGARVHVREMPKPGEPYAVYEGSPDHSLDVPQGAFVEEVDLILRPFKGTFVPGKAGF